MYWKQYIWKRYLLLLWCAAYAQKHGRSRGRRSLPPTVRALREDGTDSGCICAGWFLHSAYSKPGVVEIWCRLFYCGYTVMQRKNPGQRRFKTLSWFRECKDEVHQLSLGRSSCSDTDNWILQNPIHCWIICTDVLLFCWFVLFLPIILLQTHLLCRHSYI